MLKYMLIKLNEDILRQIIREAIKKKKYNLSMAKYGY